MGSTITGDCLIGNHEDCPDPEDNCTCECHPIETRTGFGSISSPGNETRKRCHCAAGPGWCRCQ